MKEETDGSFTVSQVHEMTGATAAQLKNWDKEGILVAKRSGEGISNNRKLYSMQDVQNVREILLYRKLGFSLEKIKEIIDAPRSDRASLVAMRTEELKEDYSLMKKKIELSSALEAVDIDDLSEELACLDNTDGIIEAYDKDKGLKGLVRWSRSHTERDIERVAASLGEALEAIACLPDDASWEQVQAGIARFCDAWSRSFSWPTVGEMLVFHSVFDEMDVSDEDVRGFFDAEACKALSDVFLLAWASSALKCVEDDLVMLYWSCLDGVSAQQVHEAASVLWAGAAEFSHHPHLSSSSFPPQQKDRLCRIAIEVYGLLEEVALDERLEHCMHLDELYAVDGPSLETSLQIILAYIEGRLDEWLSSGGASQIDRCIDSWLDALHSKWETMADDPSFAGGMARDGHSEEADDERFSAWVEEHYAATLADPPEARWSTEEEDCMVEKTTREFMQDMEEKAEGD